MDVEGYIGAVRAVAADADRLARALRRVHGPRDEAVLNVHAYALRPYEAYLRAHYADGTPRVAVLPMNPGKYGAVQTGIPFTDVPKARALVAGFDALVDRAPVDRLGLRPHQEQSCRRVHGWGVHRFGSEAALLGRVLVLLPCPIAILTTGAKVNNVPVETLPTAERARLVEWIAQQTARLVAAAEPSGLLLMGRWAEGVWARVQEQRLAPPLRTGQCLHPAAHVPDRMLFASMDAGYAAAAGSEHP